MKKFIHILIFLSSFQTLKAQITTPIIKANFGIEGELSANYFFNNPMASVDDWFHNGNVGTGKGVIDTTGAAAIVADYTLNPGSKKNSFSRPMAFPGYAIVNSRLLLDAVYYRDYHGVDSTVFAAGSNKNGMSPNIWTTPVAQSIPDKNDILEAMVHVRRAGPNVTDSLWLFTGLSLENVTGNRFFDFELYQTDIQYNKSTGKFVGFGPDAGHTSWQMDAGGNIRKPGDIIFTAEFSSSTLTLVEARIWVHKSMLSITPATFNWGGQFDGDGSGASYGYANILPKAAGYFYTGLQSAAAATWAGPYKVVRDNETVLNDYIPRQFMEFSVNLTKLGIEPANYSGNACGQPFIRVVVKTRSSTSFSSELKDFVAPFKFFDYPPVEAYSFLTYFCGVMPTVNLTTINPNPFSTYTWSTINGNIVGSNIGPSIFINAPGTYYVQQQLNAACPATSRDSIVILFDPICAVLDVNITSLKATVNSINNVLKWQASNNEDAARYEIEYSNDNINFMSLGYIDPKNTSGDISYEFSHLSSSINANIIFYRIKVIGKNGASKWSNIVILRKNANDKKEGSIFPNPTNGVLWFNYHSTKNETADLVIFDNYGKVIINSKITITTGENLIKLPSLSKKPQGTYLAKIKTTTDYIIQKIILMQ